MTAIAEAEVLGVRIRRRSRREVLESIRELLADPGPHSVYFVHAATANLAFEDAAYRAVLNRGDLVLNDGIGVRWAARSNGLALEENLVGTDLLPQIFQQAAERPLRIYLLGGCPEVAERAASFLRDQYPGILVAGFHDGYFSPRQEEAVVEEINRLAPDLLLVGMGNPRQEFFIDRCLPRLRCQVAMGVGGLFDHFSGRLRRASPWIRRSGLEWLQLLAQQPHKWRRYLLGNPKFLWRAFGGMLRRRAGRGAIAGLSFVLALLAAEAVARATRPQILERYPEGLYISSPSRQYKLRPHFRGTFRYPEFQITVSINGQGLRGSREYGPPAPDVRRILAVGDSFTMGYSVEEELTWTRRLEALLNSRAPARRYEVINAGVPGYSTRQELAYLEEEGLALAPETVLLGFFIGNDITDNARPVLPVVLEEGRLISANAEAGVLPLSFRVALARHSHLYHLAWPAQRVVRRLPADQDPLERYAAYTGRAEAGWQATAELLDRLGRLCAARGVRPIVVLIPERAQAEPEAGRRPAAQLSRGGTAFDPALPNRRMRELCRAAGIELLDLLETLPGPGLYFPQDGHWTARGNAAAARAVAEYLSP